MHFTSIDKISKKLPFKACELLSSSPLIPLVYHTVGYIDEMPYVKGLYNVFTPEEFEKDLDFILTKYCPLDLDGLLKYKQTKQLPGKHKYFFLSFDDGLRQCSEIIVPILEKKGVPATFFINTGFVGNTDFLHRFKVVLLSEAIKKDKSERLKNRLENYLEMQFTCRYKAAKFVMTLRYPQSSDISKIIHHLELDIDAQLNNFQPYMSKVEIQSLISKGFTVGAHSVDHPEYYLLSETEQLLQTVNSLKTMDDWFNPKHKAFAFPFTDVGVNNSFFEKLKELYPVDLTFGCSGIKKDKVHFNAHRIPMDDLGLRAEERLKSEYLHYFFKTLIGKSTFKRK